MNDTTLFQKKPSLKLLYKSNHLTYHFLREEYEESFKNLAYPLFYMPLQTISSAIYGE